MLIRSCWTELKGCSKKRKETWISWAVKGDQSKMANWSSSKLLKKGGLSLRNNWRAIKLLEITSNVFARCNLELILYGNPDYYIDQASLRRLRMHCYA